MKVNKAVSGGGSYDIVHRDEKGDDELALDEIVEQPQNGGACAPVMIMPTDGYKTKLHG